MCAQVHGHTPSSSNATGKSKDNFHGSIAHTSTCDTFSSAKILHISRHWQHGWHMPEGLGNFPSVIASHVNLWQVRLNRHRSSLIIGQTSCTSFTLLFPNLPLISPRSAYSLLSYLPPVFVSASVGVAPPSELLTSLSQHLMPSAWLNSQSSSVSLVLFKKKIS